MITHGVDEFMDDLRRTWCGINLEPMDPRPADDAVVDCMSCLVEKARGVTIIGCAYSNPFMGSVQ